MTQSSVYIEENVMNKIDEIVEKISPSSQINADLIDAIDLEEFIIRVINNSQLSCRKMAVAARIVSKRVFWETTVNEGYEIVREIHRYVNDTLIEDNGRDNDSRFRHYIYGFLFKVST